MEPLPIQWTCSGANRNGSPKPPDLHHNASRLERASRSICIIVPVPLPQIAKRSHFRKLGTDVPFQSLLDVSGIPANQQFTSDAAGTQCLANQPVPRLTLTRTLSGKALDSVWS